VVLVLRAVCVDEGGGLPLRAAACWRDLVVEKQNEKSGHLGWIRSKQALNRSTMNRSTHKKQGAAPVHKVEVKCAAHGCFFVAFVVTALQKNR
jgi:hypothetical protein